MKPSARANVYPMTPVTLIPQAHPALPARTIALCRGDSELQFGLSDDVAVTVPLPRGVRAKDMLAILQRLDGETPLPHAFASSSLSASYEDSIAEFVDSLVSEGVLERGRATPDSWGMPTPGPSTGGRSAESDEYIVHMVGRGDMARRVETPLSHAGFRCRWSERVGIRLDLDRPPWKRCDPADIVVLADDLVPDPLILDALTRSGTPHIYLACRDGRVVVGPMVVPGDSACLRCADLYRADRNELWPVMSAQLLFTSGWAPIPSRVSAVALVLAELNTLRRSGPESMLTYGHSVEISVEEGLWRRRKWQPHARCHCGASRADFGIVVA